MSSIFNKRYPFGVKTFVISPFFKLINSLLIDLFNEFCFIHPSFPPTTELSEILCINAALSKFSLLISFKILVYFSFKLSLFVILKTISDKRKFFHLQQILI